MCNQLYSNFLNTHRNCQSNLRRNYLNMCYCNYILQGHHQDRRRLTMLLQIMKYPK